MKIAVVGATGMVGEVMLNGRNFPVTELIPVAADQLGGK
jgi:aspartate-semialdehyde dehydrogenase